MKSLSLTLPVRIEEWKLRHGCQRSPAAMLDRDLDLELIADSVFRCLEMRQGQILLEQWGPAAACSVANLPRSAVHGLTHSPGDVRETGRESTFGMHRLERIPIDCQTDESPCRGLGAFGVVSRSSGVRSL